MNYPIPTLENHKTEPSMHKNPFRKLNENHFNRIITQVKL